MSLLTPWYIELGRWALRHWRIIAIVVGALVLIITVGIIFRACKPRPKLNEAEIQKAEQAVRERNDKELREILANSDAREARIDADVEKAEAETERVKEESIKKYENMTVDDLAAELEKRK